MHIRIGFILELMTPEPAVLLDELGHLAKHAGDAQSRRSENYLGAEKSHHLAPLDAEILTHHHDQRIAFLRANHRKTDAGIAAGRLDHSLSRLELAAALGFLDNTQCQSV